MIRPIFVVLYISFIPDSTTYNQGASSWSFNAPKFYALFGGLGPKHNIHLQSCSLFIGFRRGTFPGLVLGIEGYGIVQAQVTHTHYSFDDGFSILLNLPYVTIYSLSTNKHKFIRIKVLVKHSMSFYYSRKLFLAHVVSSCVVSYATFYPSQTNIIFGALGLDDMQG